MAPALPSRFEPDNLPILSRNDVYQLIGEATVHALVDDCGHQPPQADCFGCGMDHVLRGLCVLLRDRGA